MAKFKLDHLRFYCKSDFFDRKIRKIRNWNQSWVLIGGTPCKCEFRKVLAPLWYGKEGRFGLVMVGFQSPLLKIRLLENKFAMSPLPLGTTTHKKLGFLYVWCEKNLATCVYYLWFAKGIYNQVCSKKMAKSSFLHTLKSQTLASLG